ncbi:MAG: tetratricopeptide repeat protein [Spirochaetes bacterium]|nr:tetratricopeptide repeat protein [Spirochaetota bacterium]
MKHRELVHREYQYQESEDSYEIGCQWIEQNDLAKAEQFLKRAIDLNENFIYAYITLAEVYGKLKRWHDAIHLLSKASALDPDFDRLHFLMSFYANEAGDFVSALRHIARAIQLNPDPSYLALQEEVRGAVGRREGTGYYHS